MNPTLFSRFTAILLYLYSFNVFSQTDSLRIDSTSADITITYLYDTVDLYHTIATYTLDIDKNGVSDLEFDYLSHQGSGAQETYLRLLGSDSCFFAINPKGKGYAYETGKTDTIFYFRPIVRKFEYQNTIYADSCTKQIETDFFHYGYYPPQPTYYRLIEWLNGTHYFGIKKMMNGNAYLGWVKIEIDFRLIIKEYGIQTLPVSIDENTNEHIHIYPNPATTSLTVQGVHCKKVELFDLYGKCVLTNENLNSLQSPVLFNLENIVPGIYFLKLTGADNTHFSVRKIIKQ